MLNQEKLKESIARRLNENSGEVVKNLFIFQPSQFNIHKKNGSAYAKPELPQRKTKQKTMMNFPAGFQTMAKQTEDNLSEQEKFMIIKPQKAPTIEISSYLLGLTSKMVNKTGEFNLKEEGKQEQQGNSPTQRRQFSAKEERIQAFIRKLKEKKKIENYVRQNKMNETQQIELPHLDKKIQKQGDSNRSSHRFNKSTLTPKLHYKNRSAQIKNTSSKFRDQNKQKQRQRERERQKNLETLKKIYPTKHFSVNLFKPLDILLSKGYIMYEDGSKQFLEAHLQNISRKPQNKLHIPQLTASNFLIVNRNTLQVILQRKSSQMIQIASLSKIMTCFLCLIVCKKFGVDIQSYWTRVSDKAAQMPGTSAQLQAGDVISLNSLLYGLMLPSGNDASVAVAEAIGKIIQKIKKKPSKKTYYQTFIAHMNIFAKELEIDQEYQNSSGLSFNPNLSTPKALTILTALALRNRKFKELINTKEYETQIKNERFGLVRKLSWKNTNKLLWKGWQGVKTGTTETAGHCLMSYKQNLLISVYDCQSLSKRFSECIKLYEKVRKQ